MLYSAHCLLLSSVGQASLRVFVQKIFQNKLFGFAGISPVRVLLTNETPFVREN